MRVIRSLRFKREELITREHPIEVKVSEYRFN